jgi:translation initiation factor IF-3
LRKVRINEQIWAREVRLIDEKGNQLGIVSRDQAMEIASSRNLDLVEVSPESKPPVCRVINYDKFRYQLAKKEKEQQRHSKRVELKEIRLGVRTGEHDLDFKRNRAIKFLKEGKKVKIEIVLKGREHTHRDLAREVINEFLEKIKEDIPVKIDQPIMGSPRGFNCVIAK